VLYAIRQLQQDEAGFTLVELMIVTLIMGILATIALPAFLGQRTKAWDAHAKQSANTALIALESCAAESVGLYTACSANVLREMDPSLPPNPTLKVNGLGPSKYTIVVQSQPKSDTFTIKRTNKGVVSFTCNKKGVGGCPADGRWD
jgi:type IV pilus assembly protein PilA